VGVVTGREADRRRAAAVAPGAAGDGRQQAGERAHVERQGPPDGAHDALDVGLAGDSQDLRMPLEDLLRAFAEAAGDDDPATAGGQGLADVVESILDRRRDDAAGVDDHQLGVVIALDKLVAVGAELTDDALAVDQRLGATEAHEADAARDAEAAGRRGGGGAVCAHAVRECSRGLRLPARYSEPATSSRPPGGVRSSARSRAAAGSSISSRGGTPPLVAGPRWPSSLPACSSGAPAKWLRSSPGSTAVTTTAAALGRSAARVAAPCLRASAPNSST